MLLNHRTIEIFNLRTHYRNMKILQLIGLSQINNAKCVITDN